MSDPRHDLLQPGEDVRSAARKPFVRPTVQEIGGLSDLTLVGGSL